MCMLLVLLAVGSRAEELERWETLQSGVRLYVNAPGRVQGPVVLLVYATPNGNTIEETLGAKDFDSKTEWRFDIQHVLAQTRFVRQMEKDRAVVLAVTQAPTLSWPAFRAGNARAGEVIDAVIGSAARGLDEKQLKIALSGHSGGGSFIFGYINAHERIGANVERIILLDANYPYSDEQKHGEKLIAWMKGDVARRLVVLAYDDRQITLDGKKVVGPDGGTFRATGRMVKRLREEVEVSETAENPFLRYCAMKGQFEAFVHPNPENKILHTALVGEMNGLVHGMMLGKDARWGNLVGPRVYSEFIGVRRVAAAQAATTPVLLLPERGKNAMTGSAFAELIARLSREEREAAIVKEVLAGNVPKHLRALAPMKVKIEGHEAEVFVMRDYLGVGSETDWVRMPMTPQSARKIADACGGSLITRKVSDEVWKNAGIKLDPKPLAQQREAVETFLRHHAMIEEQLSAFKVKSGSIVAGIKKDVVFSNRLNEKPNRVAIFGWHFPDGKAIQPLTIVHVDWYVDYSHGVRLMSRDVRVDGRWMTAEEVLKNPILASLMSDEGMMNCEKFYRNDRVR